MKVGDELNGVGRCWLHSTLTMTLTL